jgi:hypothetical protein
MSITNAGPVALQPRSESDAILALFDRALASDGGSVDGPHQVGGPLRPDAAEEGRAGVLAGLRSVSGDVPGNRAEP